MSGVQDREPVRAGRELGAGVVVLSTVVALISIAVGALLVVAALTGRAAGPWVSPEALSPGLLGAAMLGTSPALLTIGRAGTWEEVRTLAWPLAVVLTGLFAVSLVNAGDLRVVTGGPILLVMFSLGWVATLALLAAGALVALALQYRVPAGPPAPRTAPLPAWSKPLLALLGAGWSGVGAGLLVAPGFWGALVPWQANRADAHGLGVWALALGAGVLGSLAEDDLARLRPALLALPGVSLAAGVVLAVRAPDVDWSSGAAWCLAGLVAGLLVTGVSGRLLLTRRRGTAPATASATASPSAPLSG
ncbi:hypothetical protein [Streptomyces laurentii]|uniref:hypothetical protein n=1 Tax=Streptomyces laurentii TaxID=39478 RepID=UPI0036CE1E3C